MHYRSDWPEVGWSTPLREQPLREQPPGRVAASVDDHQAWAQETRFAGAVFRWIATHSEFESQLYGLPIWNLRIEVDDPAGNLLTAGLDTPALRQFVSERACQLFDLSPWGGAYVSVKVVRDEPLYGALRQLGYGKVEHRRIYACKVRDIVCGVSASAKSRIRFTSLAAVGPDRISAYREQVLDICREAFEEKGHSRHFLDPVLLERSPGIAYILAVMALNFEHATPDHFLVANDVSSDRVCGFSVVGSKPGLEGDVYAQLLSAVRAAYRGQGIYRGLSHLLSRTLPQDATLLNVTHVDNLAMQRAYRDSGRVHVADVVVLRRMYAR